MVRQFYLINEKNKQFSFMDIEKYCLLTEPEGLGFSYNRSYERIENTFIDYSELLNQSTISGICNFKKYCNYKSLVDFIEKSNDLKLVYKIPSENQYLEYRRDVKLKELSKNEIKTNNFLSCNISFECISLWYTEQIYSYKIQPESNTVRWNFKWPSRWRSYNNRRIEFNNEGHTAAPFRLEINGIVENPTIEIKNNYNETIYSLTIPITINEGEKFIYSSIDNDLIIAKQLEDGSIISLFKQEYIDITNDNIFKIPIGVNSIIVSAEQDVEDAILTIYPYYKSV